MSKSDKDTERQIRPFADFVRELSKGRTHEEASRLLNELAIAVEDTGKAGTITITIAIKPQKGASHLVITDSVRAKIPEHDRPNQVFWSNGGNLQRTDPDQPTLGLRGLPGDTDERPSERREAQ